jgi:multicomponent K+:H+ antiporter subunit G
MMQAPALPDWAALLTAALMLLGSGLTLAGSLGLLRLASFYERVHAPTLGTTLGAGAILVASMTCFSVLQTRPVLHELLIAVFVTVTTPVTLMLLVRAALHRDRREGNSAVLEVQPDETSDTIAAPEQTSGSATSA